MARRPIKCVDCQKAPRQGRSPRCPDCRRAHRTRQQTERQRSRRANERPDLTDLSLKARAAEVRTALIQFLLNAEVQKLEAHQQHPRKNLHVSSTYFYDFINALTMIVNLTDEDVMNPFGPLMDLRYQAGI